MALVPSLMFLNIRVSSPSITFLSVLSTLGTSCPHLQDVIVKIPSAADNLIHKISPFLAQPISQLNNLHSLAIWDLGNQGIEHIMQLQTLQSLTLDLRVASSVEPYLQFPGFHGSNLLCLIAYALDDISNFLSSLQVVRSKEINVRLMPSRPSNSGSTMLSQFFAVLQERCDSDILESFTFVDLSSKAPVQLDVFTPLHAYCNLTKLYISRDHDISISDEELSHLVKAWPKLEALTLSGYIFIDGITVPTFHGLFSLLRLCPALTTLSLVIDTTKLDGIDLQCPGGGICNKNLKDLVLGNSCIESPLNVALILSSIFPHLERVGLNCWGLAPIISPEELSAIEQWRLVNSFLYGFGVVRKRGVVE
ncbi:hypothetical protein AZE42_12017 [Rhizopogon vesiculosus]|uniref:F-box domain-containing protein n=1 Tax=Rhizopogon vesiculosus TaxID=180088 RepID=A0A1J8QVE2_9AGAM|nr:hypothetical protein AZE42_12017 [Rhizopogon vesiculosus]